jgi:hypothetical protein
MSGKQLMGTTQERTGSERGLVLLSSLLILSLLIVVGAGARVMLQNDYRILANLRRSTEAFYIADAGIEWSKLQIARSVTHPPSPANHAQSFSSGTFEVTFQSPTVVTPLVAKVEVYSTGTAGRSNQVIRAQVTKQYDLADGAVGLRGNTGRVAFTGDAYLVSGRDHDPASGKPIAGSRSRHAISVPDDGLRQLVESALGGDPSPHVITDRSDALPIGQTDFISGPAIAALAAELCSAPHAVSTNVPAEGTLYIDSQTWGSRTSPQLTCIDGLPGPGDSVQLAGVSGAGILVISNAEVVAHGSFHWEGWVIVTGNNVGFRVTGPAIKEIFGALIVNETDSPLTGVSLLDIQGSLKLLFSRPALHKAAELVPASVMVNTYSSLPFFVSQNFWRTVQP